jgi:hypothetical protein
MSKSLLKRLAWQDNRIYTVDVGFTKGKVHVIDNTVSDADPVFIWMKGRHWPTILKWDKIVNVSHGVKIGD